MNKVAIVQARVGSTRLPGKIFADLVGKPFVWHVIDRLKAAKEIDEIIFAIPDDPRDDELQSYIEKIGLKCFRGNLGDVLKRFYQTAKEYKADIIIRITADDPFKDPDVIDKTVRLLTENNLDFAYNNNPPTFPEGLDVEVFTFDALKKANEEATSTFDGEHVTQYMHRNPQKFKQANLSNDKDLSYLRWTVDEQADLDMTREIYDALYKEGQIFKTKEILDLLNDHPNIANINKIVNRSTMYKKN